MPASAVVVDHCPRLLAHAHRRHLRLLLELLLRLRLHWSRWRAAGGLLCVDDSRWNLHLHRHHLRLRLRLRLRLLPWTGLTRLRYCIRWHLHRLGIRKGCRLRNRLLLTILYRV